VQARNDQAVILGHWFRGLQFGRVVTSGVASLPRGWANGLVSCRRSRVGTARFCWAPLRYQQERQSVNRPHPQKHPQTEADFGILQEDAGNGKECGLLEIASIRAPLRPFCYS